MRKNTAHLKKCGWTTEKLENRINVTCQMINNIESVRNKLTKIEYVEIRIVLDTEIIEVLLYGLIDHPEIYSKDERE